MITLNDITSFDVIVVLIFLLFIIRGSWIGFMRQMAVFLALIGSYLLAGKYAGYIMPHVSGFIANPKAVFYISFALLFVLGSIFMFLAGKALLLVVEVTMAGWFDRTLGMLLGVVKAMFVASILYMAMSSSLVSSNELLQKSITSPFLARGAEFVQEVISDRELRELFRPKEPAIPQEIIPDINIELPEFFKPDNESGEEGAENKG
ncbi:MAG: CvpA family protein [Desulfobulbaceae bacterium]|nr:CvpA family protein [Desulfobulbaceae bacterium]